MVRNKSKAEALEGRGREAVVGDFLEPENLGSALVLTEDGHEGKVYTLTGPAAISLYDVAETLSGVLGKEVAHVNVPLERARAVMLDRGIPE